MKTPDQKDKLATQKRAQRYKLKLKNASTELEAEAIAIQYKKSEASRGKTVDRKQFSFSDKQMLEALHLKLGIDKLSEKLASARREYRAEYNKIKYRRKLSDLEQVSPTTYSNPFAEQDEELAKDAEQKENELARKNMTPEELEQEDLYNQMIADLEREEERDANT